MKKFFLCVYFTCFIVCAAQKADLKGFIYDSKSGERIQNAFVWSTIDNRIVSTDDQGYYAYSGLPYGKATFFYTATDYDTFSVELTIQSAQVKQDVYLKSTGGTVVVQAKVKKIEEISTVVQPKDIKKLPAVGGEPDLIQFLQMGGGVVFTGDQGGQLYIRGGSPVMNKIMLDGMTIYNPFHSIGLFSVFETELIKSTDIYSAGFVAQYGGRISAVIDVKTRDGNKNKTKGKASVGTFLSKLVLEGPIKKFAKGESNSSFNFSWKNSYLTQSSKLFYKYADPNKLPYNFNDLFLKYTLNSANGGYLNLYGFDFRDNVKFPQATAFNWKSQGAGGKFLVVPELAKTRVDGFFLYSNYKITQSEKDNKPRSSGIGGFSLGLNFNYNFKRDQLRWGVDLNAFTTNFIIYNANNRRIQQEESTTEINGYLDYKLRFNGWLINPGFRTQYYASLGNRSYEPRILINYRFNSNVTFKFSSGYYSQNLISANSDRDVVNLFYGFLSGPDNLPNTFNGKAVTHKLQKSRHAVGGFEFFSNKKDLKINLEGFYKSFDQISNINREKLFDDDENNINKPDRLKQDFIIETGNAYGGDITIKYEKNKIYFWGVYSLTYVNRFDGFLTYQPIFDRRHNINLLASYELFKKPKRKNIKHQEAEFSLRWNFGSGFPFTQTQAFYEKFDFADGLGTNYVNGNGKLGIIYGAVNQGRLPYYHRMDISYRHDFYSGKETVLGFLFTITNVYNRANIFYIDRITLKRVNQLPFLPAASFTYSF